MSSSQYPAEVFRKGFAPDAKEHVEPMNQPGKRPGKQGDLGPRPVDDVYADGRPYKGAEKLAGKKAWISGGDSGIGRSMAILFALEGADSTLVYLPEEQDDAESVRDYIKEKAPERKVHLVALDLKSDANCQKAVESHLKAFNGQLDILVNNSAQQLENNDVTTLSSKQWEDTFQLNMHSYFYVTKAALPSMKPGSSIINVCSINAFVGRPDLLDYTSTKGAIVSFTRGLSNQIISERQIRVNSIAPGPIWTPLVPSTFSEKNVAGVNSVPIGRPGQPVEVATCAVFLASPDSSYISGQTIHCNGGVVIS